MSGTAPTERSRLVLPSPRVVESGEGSYRDHPRAALRIRGYDGESGPLAGALREAGFGSRVEVIAEGPLQLTFDRPGEERIGRAERSLKKTLAAIKDPRVAEQAYALEVGKTGIVAVAGGGPGLYYAARTLSRLMEEDGTVPAASIRDWPRLPYRAALLDLSRGRVANLAALLELVDLLASLKFNQLTFNLEHVFFYPQRPEIGKETDRLTPEEMSRLALYAADRRVELIPFQQSLGHLRRLVSNPAYRHLAYDPKLNWSIDPGKDEIYALLADLYDAQIEATASTFFHVGCDEPFDIIKRFDPARFGGRSLAAVIRDHLLRLHQILTKRGRTMMCWADAVLGRPEILPDLPDDLWLCHWLYGTGALEGPDHYRPGLERIADRGLPFHACACSWSMTKVFPDLAVARANHAAFVSEAKRLGARGLMVTIWGDLGHMNQTGLDAYPLALAARHGWEDELDPETDFSRGYSWTVFQDREGAAGKLAETADQVNALLPGIAGMGGVGFLLFFAEPLSIALLDPKADLAAAAVKLWQAAEQARAILSSLLASKPPHPTYLQDYRVPIAQLEYLSLKLELIEFIRAAWPGRGPAGGDLAALEAAGVKMAEMAELVEVVFGQLELRWLAASKRSELGENQKRFGRLAEAWRARARQLAAIVAAARQGETPPPLTKYLATAPEGYAFDFLAEIGLSGLL